MKSHSRILLSLCALLLFGQPAFAQQITGQSGPYDDPRVVAWSKDFLAGKRAEVIRAVEADLKSPSPHPFAAHIWVITQNSLERLKEEWASLNDPASRRALGELPEVFLLYDAGEYDKLLVQFPQAKAAEIKNPWAAYFLYQAATEQNRFLDALTYLTVFANLSPPNFLAVWDSYYCAVSDGRVWLELSERIKPGGVWAGTRLGQTLEILMQSRTITAPMRIAAAKAWLADFPADSLALRFLAIQMREIEQFAKAAEYFNQSEERYPFGVIYLLETWDPHAACLIRLGKNEEARQVVARSARLDIKENAEAECRAARRWVVANISAGEKGVARDAADAELKRYEQTPALKRYEDYAMLLDSYAGLELESNSSRYAIAAAYAQKASQAAPRNEGHQLRLIEARQKSGDLDAAYALLVEARKSFQKPSAAFYTRGADLLKALQDDRSSQTADRKFTQEWVQLCEEALRQYPESERMLLKSAEALNAAGRTAEAIERLRQALAIEADNEWTIGKLREWMRQLYGEAKADQEMAALKERFPWSRTLWVDAVQRLDERNVEGKLLLWKEARERAIGAYWPWGEAINLLAGQNKLAEARDLASDAINYLKRHRSPNVDNAYADRAWQTINAINYGRIKNPELDEALADLESYRENNGYLGYYHHVRSRLLLAQGRKKDAWQAIMAATQIRPDEAEYISQMMNGDYGAENREGHFAHALHHKDRDPYDGERINLLANLHLKWGGSSIIAFQLSELCLRHDPDKYKSAGLDEIGWQARGNLGERAQKFTEVYYKSRTGISPSDRYLRWFEGTRLAAQRESYDVEFGPALGRAKIKHPDGLEEVREDNPITGKRELLQLGKAFIRLGYGPKGETLLKVQTSSGANLTLGYDTSNRINRVVAAGGDDIEIEYEAQDRVSVVRVKGAGELKFLPDADGKLRIENRSGPQVEALRKRSFAVLEPILRLSGLMKQWQQGELPDLPFDDPALRTLRQAEKSAIKEDGARATEQTTLALLRGRLDVARHLVNHVGDKLGYNEEARTQLQDLFEKVLEDDSNRTSAIGAETMTLWHSLMLRTRLHGLNEDDWGLWDDMRRWLDRRLNADDGGKVALLEASRKISEPLLEMLPDAKWLSRSYLNIDGYWRRIELGSLLPRTFSAATPTAVLIRRNHQEVIGTDRGLLVWKDYWRWLTFDKTSRRLSMGVAAADLTASSHIRALAEDDDGALWIGTNNGLFKVPGDDYEKIERWTNIGGPATTAIECLTAAKGGVYIGTATGLWMTTKDGSKRVDGVPAEPVKFLRGPSEEDSPETPVIAGTQSGIFALSAQGGVIKLTSTQAKDALLSPGLKLLFWLDGNDLRCQSWDGEKLVGKPRLLSGVQKTEFVYGLASLPIDKKVHGVAALTDQGLSIYYNDHFEHKNLPLSDGVAAARGLATRDGRTLVISTLAVYALDRGRVRGDKDGRVYDIVTDNNLGATFIARGSKLQVVRHAAWEKGAERFSEIKATHLALHPDGRLLANNGQRILAYSRGSKTARLLFTARSTFPSNYGKPGTADEVTSILAARDGTIWVTAGASVFRYANGKADEFNIFVDPSQFPAQSDMVSRVIETVDGRILVVASDEGHRQLNSQPLRGGLLQWTGTAFRMLEIDREKLSSSKPSVDSLWFLTGYTPIDQRTAIVATGGAFARERDGELVSYASLQDVSYQRLSDRLPMFWLGTKGAKLGQDTWLFGCAGGIAGYRFGQWFYPDRINWMLPDQELRERGSKAVHAIATDNHGRIYAGTDRGLLIFDCGGGDGAALMLSNDQPYLAFEALEQAKLQRERELFLRKMPPDSELAKLAAQAISARDEVEKLEHQISGAANNTLQLPSLKASAAAKVQPVTSKEEKERLEREREKKQNEYARKLLELASRNPGLHKMLECKPLEMKAMRHQLANGQVVIQFLPDKEAGKLLINVLRKDGDPVVREVTVDLNALMSRARDVSMALAVIASGGSGPQEAIEALNRITLTEELAWLYAQLLRPIEDDLKNSSHIYVVPYGALSHLPFAALVSSTQPEVRYAVQDYTFGYLTSLYLLNLMGESKKPTSIESLIVANTNGDLAGAEIEAREVKTILGGSLKPLLGDDATFENFRRDCPQARYLHMATHGYLDAEKPEQSHLLLAGGYRLNLIDVCTMESYLAENDLTVLSACETGIGKEGSEYETLAWAFSIAKTPTVIATLWKISDERSPALVKSFYLNLIAGKKDRLTALAEAQREMIGSKENPAFWSGFIAFGKP